MTTAAAKNFDQKTRFKSLYCKNNATDTVVFRECKIRVTRNSSWISVDFTVKKRVDKPVYIRGDVYYKYGQIYRKIVSVPEFEICYFLERYDNIKNAHPVLAALDDVVGKTLKPLLTGCPYFGHYNASILLNDLELPSLFPSGMYKGEIFHRFPGGGLVLLIVQVECISSIKTSF